MLAAAAAVSAVFAGGAGAATPKLTASVSDPVNISLKMGTKKVTSLKAGKYKIVIRDLSDIHNFHLTGPGVNKKTSVGAKGTSTWMVTLKKGTYKFICDPHASIMKGSFKVT
jgi:plastocyanin